MKLSINVFTLLLFVISSLLIFRYKIGAYPPKTIKKGDYRLEIIDSILLKNNTNYNIVSYRNNHLYNCMPFNFEVYEMNGKLLHHYIGQVTSCPIPKLRTKTPQRIYNFGEEDNKMFVWDDFGECFFMYKNHTLIQKIKTPLATKNNYTLQRNLNDLYLLDTLHLLASIIPNEVESGKRSIGLKDPMFAKINIRTGKTSYFGTWDSLYYELEPASIYCEDNEKLSEEEKVKKSVIKRVRAVRYQYIKGQNKLYYVEKASNKLKIIDFKDNKTTIRQLNDNAKLPIPPVECSQWENASIYYDEVSNAFIRVLECYNDKKMYHSHQKTPIQKLLEIYDLNTNQTITQIILPDNLSHFICAMPNLKELWFQKFNNKFYGQTVIYKLKLTTQS